MIALGIATTDQNSNYISQQSSTATTFHNRAGQQLHFEIANNGMGTSKELERQVGEETPKIQ